jgi:hypothetical protein
MPLSAVSKQKTVPVDLIFVHNEVGGDFFCMSVLLGHLSPQEQRREQNTEGYKVACNRLLMAVLGLELSTVRQYGSKDLKYAKMPSHHRRTLARELLHIQVSEAAKAGRLVKVIHKEQNEQPTSKGTSLFSAKASSGNLSGSQGSYGRAKFFND